MLTKKFYRFGQRKSVIKNEFKKLRKILFYLFKMWRHDTHPNDAQPETCCITVKCICSAESGSLAVMMSVVMTSVAAPKKYLVQTPILTTRK